jgi:carbon-monoxide dehydrogenase large subunit
MNAVPPKFGMGAAVRRREDNALLMGAGKFTDDFAPEGTLRAVVLRSEMAHAKISLGDLTDVRAMPGVRLVLTHDDLDGISGLPCNGDIRTIDGNFPTKTYHPLLCDKTVHHVGDPIAFIVADTVEAGITAMESIEVDYEGLEAVVDMPSALADNAPLLFPELGSNVAFECTLGPRQATDEAFERAAKICKLELVNNRVVANYMETRGILAEYDAQTERFTLTLGTQGSHGMRDVIAEDVLNIDKKQIRVITPDVGGGFGTKFFVYQEYPLAAIAARTLGKPVKWIGDRREHFLADSHGRDNISVAEMALDKDGHFIAMRTDMLANMGGYLSQFAPLIPQGGMTMLTGVYKIPLAFSRCRAIYTNTSTVDAYRGAGRPEAAYLIERLVDVCGRETGLGSVEIRRRNFIPPEAMPYETQGGRIYDSGEFNGHMTRALEVSNQAGFEDRAAQSRQSGKVRGFGLATYIEACAFPGKEEATIDLNDDGTVTLYIGTQTNGQGHQTAYAQFIAGHLGLDYDKINLVQGDTDRVSEGDGTGGSRSIPLGAVSVDRAARKLATRIREIASASLEASVDDMELADGVVSVRGTNRGVTLAELARSVEDKSRLSVVDGSFEQPEPTYPNGSHIAEVEIDPETGVTEIVAYWIVDDFGATVNPMLLAGQVHGGAGQGLGQALMERTIYDDDGQLLTATFLDYAVPRADNLPDFAFETRNVPSKTNAFGIKGAGEAGAIGSCPAVMNAIIDALGREYGIKHLDMPATPERVWTAIREAAAN